MRKSRHTGVLQHDKDSVRSWKYRIHPVFTSQARLAGTSSARRFAKGDGYFSMSASSNDTMMLMRCCLKKAQIWVLSGNRHCRDIGDGWRLLGSACYGLRRWTVWGWVGCLRYRSEILWFLLSGLRTKARSWITKISDKADETSLFGGVSGWYVLVRIMGNDSGKDSNGCGGVRTDAPNLSPSLFGLAELGTGGWHIKLYRYGSQSFQIITVRSWQG